MVTGLCVDTRVTALQCIALRVCSVGEMVVTEENNSTAVYCTVGMQRWWNGSDRG